MIDVAVVGLGKMGLSHLSMARAHPRVNLRAVCDASGYVLDVLNKYTGVPTFTDFAEMLANTSLDAVIIATPSHLHAGMVRASLERGLDVFCEKPFCLDNGEGEALFALARSLNRVTQVGYHNRFVGSFREAKSLLESGAIGRVTHALGEAYGPVVLKPQGGTWRTQRNAGGGCLYDYAAHPIDLVTWYLGEPEGAGGSVLKRVFSRETDDEVLSTLYYPGGKTAQISVSWSDESQRKMMTKISVWGTLGRIYADRQEIRVYLQAAATPPAGYHPGWNVRYTTELTDPVWFYLRGEEYSAQIDRFVSRVEARECRGLNSFEEAVVTDRAISMILNDAARGPSLPPAAAAATSASAPSGRRIWARSR